MLVSLVYKNNSKSKPVGVVVADKIEGDPDYVTLGWSKVNLKAGDRFNKQQGVKIASIRREHGNINRPINGQLRKTVEHMKRRAARYFKNSKYFILTGVEDA